MRNSTITREQAIHELKRRASRQSFSAFITFTKKDYLLGWVHKEICDKLDKFLEDVQNKKSPRLIICLPPRSGKSEIVSRRFPAYAFGRNPELQIIATSYSSDLSQRFNRDVQRIIDDEAYFEVFPETTLAGKKANAETRGSYIRTSDLFEIVGHTGVYRSAGVGGGITGQGADILLIDDPLKDRAEANSATIRNSIWDWYTSTAYTRLSPGGGVIVMCTRWHLDDLIGRLIENMNSGAGDTFTVINYPAIAENDEPHRLKGEALHPERYDLNQLEKIRKTIGSRDWAALYQQHPIPDGGSIFKAEWIKYWTDTSVPPQFDQQLISWDMTFKDSKNSDYVVGQVWGKKGADFYLLDQVRGQWDFVKTREMFLLLAKKWPRATRKLVEDKANGSAIISELQKTVSGIIPITPKESKEARASAVTPFFEAGNVYIPDPDRTPWVSVFEAELFNFPAGAHDDQCFIAGTKVATLFGDKPIEQIKAGDFVITPFGLKKVLCAGETGEKEVITKYGITATPDHPFITRTGKIQKFIEVNFQECITLKYQNLINPILLNRLSLTALSLKEWEEKEIITLALQQQMKEERTQKVYTLPYGNISKVKRFLRGMRFTIKTGIVLTTNLVILSVYHVMNTAKKLISAPKKFLSTWKPLDLLPLRGIGAKKEGGGIRNTQRKGFRKFINAFVPIADQYSKQKEQIQNSVLENVKRNTDGNTKVTKSLRPAKFAEKNLNISKVEDADQKQLVHDPVVGNLDRKEKVFNLTIEGSHLFFANGVLVHNCDAMTQALSYYRNKAGFMLTPELMEQLKYPVRY